MSSARNKGFGFWLASVYCVAVGGFAGWRGAEFWTWQNVVVVVVPPVVLALLMAVPWWWRTSSPGPVELYVFGGVMLAGMGLILAWMMAAITEKWSSPTGRAAAGAALPAIAFVLIWAFYVPPRQAIRPQDTDDLQGRDGSGVTNG
ncbi:MAG TPA: hypothetical protein VKS79_15255 [Gemmataceae bacterium]|nr:hypothetical protein [Gemmataceae bacterium]